MKNVFVLILLAATAAFSATSISTVYYQSVRVSSYGCQEGYGSKGTLDYDARGAINKSKIDAVQANCSINVGPSEVHTESTLSLVQQIAPIIRP